MGETELLEAYWLVERGQDFGFSPPRYWTGHGHTSDAFKAKWFETRADAQSEIDAHACDHGAHYGTACLLIGRPVEHGFWVRATEPQS